jgi:ABC-2 type transport system ATP-binding protein
MNALELHHVCKRYTNHVAVDDLSFSVSPGSVFGFLGPNGAGKTSTIRMVMDIYAPDSGAIRIFGKPPGEQSRSRVGYLPEERGLYSDMKVIDQLRFFGRLYGIAKEEAERRMEQWLARFDLISYAGKQVGVLSKGTQQKIQLIVALLHDPDLVILDEPFSGLDPISVDTVKNVISDLNRAGKSVVFSAHQMEQVEQLCDDICLIDRGRCLLWGALGEIKRANAGRLLRLAFQGDAGFMNGLSGDRVKRCPEFWEVSLDSESEAREILSRGIVAGASINRFEIVSASLNDIFLKTVKGALDA